MKILLMHPIAEWSVRRFSDICLKNGWSLSISTIASSSAGEGVSGIHEWLRVDKLTTNTEEMLGQLGGRTYDAIVPGNEFAVVAADLLAKCMGLPHNDPERMVFARNKQSMRRSFEAAGIPQPRVLATVGFSDSSPLDWQVVRYPVIVKPVDMASSLFVRKCSNREEVERTLADIFQFERSFITNYAFERRALVEEFIDGPEFSLECIVDMGVLRQILLTKKYVSPFPGCFEIGHVSGLDMPSRHAQKLRSIATTIAGCWGMAKGVMHIELKMTDEAIHVIEAAARVPGCRISELVELRYGVSIEEAYVRLRAGMAWDPPAPQASPAEFVGIRFDFNERVQAEASPSLTVVKSHYDASHVLEAADPFSVDRRTGFTIARCASLEELGRFAGGL
jgi:biotin carboxylase